MGLSLGHSYCTVDLFLGIFIFSHFQCVFLLDPNYPSYVKGEKQYGFNFIEVVMEMKEEG